MTTLGRHPDALAVKLTLGDGAHLVASTVNGWAGPVTLHYGPKTGDPVISDVGTVDGDEVSWTLTEAEVTARAEHDWARLEDNGVTLAAGPVMTWLGGSGHTTTQTIASLTAGPPGPAAVSADADNVATLGTDGLIYVSPVDAGGFSDAAVAAFVADTGSSTYASILAGFAATDDPRLSDARTPTAHSHPISDVTNLQTTLDGKAAASHTHDDRYFTEAEVTASLALKADSGHGHVIDDVTGLQAALDGKQAAGSYAAASHTHGVTDLTATGTKDATTFLRGDNTWAVPAGGGGGVTDHGALTGLGDDDHTQYALADGSRGSFAATSHTHVIADTTGLQTALDGKAASSHTHTLSQVTDAGDAAAKNTGTTAGTVAAGDDSRITGAAQKSANLSDLANAGSARTNLGLGTAATTAASAYATAAQGALADTATQPGDLAAVATSGEAADLDATGATDGHVLTADGAGGAAWEAPSGGGSDPWTYAVLGSDWTCPDTNTYTNIPGLSIASGLASGVYEVRVQVVSKGNSSHHWSMGKPSGGNLYTMARAGRGLGETVVANWTAAGGNGVIEVNGHPNTTWGAVAFESTSTLTVASSTSSAITVMLRSTTGNTHTAMAGSFIAWRKIA